MSDNEVNIVIGGEAGQGLATVGQLLVRVLVRSGYSVLSWQEYESRIRGGHNTFAVRASLEPTFAPRDPIDVLVALDEATVEIHKGDLSSKRIVVRNADHAKETASGVLDVPFRDLASGRFENSVALGVLAGLMNLDREKASDIVEEYFHKSSEQTAKNNRESFESGYQWTSEQSVGFPGLSRPESKEPRLIMTGNEAIALGALSAGLKFYSFYPMSPSTSIAVTLVKWAKKMGVVVEQCEDEIAVLNMALGASFAGAPSMVGTSGGGFALMTEAVSLAGVSETPVVIVVAQRPGPATGLPSRTEQADLELVLYGGHGEFPRVVFSPGTVEECFFCTRKAFEVAALSRGPVFLLTDQYLTDCYCDIPPFDPEQLDPVRWGQPPDKPADDFLSYRMTKSGVSPRLFPGLTTEVGSPYRTEQLVIGDSHEHTEDGHVTEDRFVRQKMVEKRFSKVSVIQENMIAPVVEGDSNPDLLMISWGSTGGAVKEAASELRNTGDKVRTVHLPQVWPLPEKDLLEQFRAAKRVVCVEGNATGQLARLIRQATGFTIDERVLRYDGGPMTPEYILNRLNRDERKS